MPATFDDLNLDQKIAFIQKRIAVQQDVLAHLTALRDAITPQEKASRLTAAKTALAITVSPEEYKT